MEDIWRYSVVIYGMCVCVTQHVVSYSNFGAYCYRMPGLSVSSFNCGTSVKSRTEQKMHWHLVFGDPERVPRLSPKNHNKNKNNSTIYIYTDIFNYIHIYVNVWLKSCSLTFWHISFIGSVLKGDFDTMTWPAAKWRCVAGAVAGKKAMPWMARSFHGNGQEVIKSTAILVKCISEDLPLRPHAGVSESMEIISI